MRPISYSTYKEYAKKYKINLTNKSLVDGVYKYSKKSMKQLQQEIYDFEKQNENIRDGLYFI